ncbi:F0F1 ATP synthase subunit delta [Neomicrococcus aestuarii]|uniref:ATP synthase subunit delta n=1 Tax=Neomicrococcus aestuarii TaxID=556325 RepID=A0A1L2ZL04_9MICC|nr:F0F1 ATP synthase subunit delta [Neomicrococcus aestuarii]APF39867.1 ATP synthase F1 subunit delta [Neomicrococcus aestuarii]MBB5513917.1 F-type H+-transporting ATPase subunit delta [Neomicrococcus aestuarii]
MSRVSSESLAQAQAVLESKLGSNDVELAKELFAVLGIVDSNAGLRRALTDPSREGQDKVNLVSGLLNGKVSGATNEIVAKLAGSRWGDPRDIGDALETLGATAAISSAEKNGSEGLERLEDELFSFNRVVASSHDVQRALDEPQADATAKEKLAFALVPNASDAAKSLIGQAVAAPRGHKPTDLVQSFLGLVAKRQQRWIADVTVTRPLTDEQLRRLQNGLNNLYQRDLKINVNVNPALIGGIRVEVGDEVVDASSASRLAELRRRLAS